MDDLLSGRRILLVEDEVLVFLGIEDMLGDLGCKSVSAAGNVEEALALVDEQAFDAAILDANLNGRKSYEVADALAARDVPFVFSTGYGREGLDDGYRDLPVLQKPFLITELVKIMARLLGP